MTHLIHMIRDHVCDIEVDECTTEVRYDYEGDTYYFCSEKCKNKFIDDPESYVSRLESSQS